jgi:hypothetical protein
VKLWTEHGTKILGTAQTIVAGFITIPGLITPEMLPYWGAANVVLAAVTINRGFTNSRNAP